MADVVGLLASIINILEGIKELCAFVKQNVHSASSFRAELVPILGKLTAFKGLLDGLQLECELDEANDGRLQVFVHLSEPLRASHEAIETIMQRTEKVVSSGRVSLIFGKILDKDTVLAMGILDRTMPVLHLALSVDQRTIMLAVESYVKDISHKIDELQRQNEKYHLTSQDWAAQEREVRMDEEKAKLRSEVLAWVSRVDYRANLTSALRHMLPSNSAGDWYLQSQAFRDWLDLEEQQGILLTGSSGAGKTVLCGKSIRYLRTKDSATGKTPLVIYFFFDFNDPGKQTVEGMVRCLIHQIAAASTDVPESLMRLFKRNRSSRSSDSVMSTEAWIQTLLSITQAAGPCHAVVDALDECEDSGQRLLVTTIKRLCQNTPQSMKWMFTCRPSSVLVREMTSIEVGHIQMSDTTVDADIERYLSERFDEDPDLESFSQTARSLIVKKITAKAGGMFRWAECQLNALQSMKDRRAKRIQESLEMLPADIFKTYSRIIGSFEHSSEKSLAARILMFVCYSARPVTVAEVAEFAILEDGMKSVDPQDRLEDFAGIIAPLNSLLDIRGEILALSHKSVQEFLIAGHRRGLLKVLPGNEVMFDAGGGADWYIATRCLQYLAIEQKPIRELALPVDGSRPNASHLAGLHKRYPLLEYAASRWAHHVRRKDAQLSLYRQLNDALSVTAAPNLWKAWIMLQPADIWENQLALCRVVAEATIRGSACPTWSAGFWKERQLYRISTPTREEKPEVSSEQATRETGPPSTNAASDIPEKKTAQMKARDVYLARALRDCSTPGHLSFSKGDIITLRPTESRSTWVGKKRKGSGFVDSKDVEISSRPIPHLMGIPFYQLAVALLEIAHQSTLAARDLEPIESISSETDFAAHLKALDKFVDQAGSIMGTSYEVIVRECLRNVVYASENLMMDVYLEMQGLTFDSDLHLRTLPEAAWTMFMKQDQAMEEIYAPLQAMVKSGFRASRQIFVPHRVQQQLRISRQFASRSPTSQDGQLGVFPSNPSPVAPSEMDYSTSSTSLDAGGRWSAQPAPVARASPEVYGGRWSAQAATSPSPRGSPYPQQQQQQRERGKPSRVGIASTADIPPIPPIPPLPKHMVPQVLVQSGHTPSAG
ncbi:hypothetical protein LTR06_006953 [Exophiala xenobiotica]|nr:hypothetical protein LTR06_006953 [Exophiala xenobiotica]